MYAFVNQLGSILCRFDTGLDVRKPVFGVCEQQRRRPACASAQSDQRLCFSLFEKYYIQTCYRRIFNFLASLCSRAGWFESGFVRNPEDRFSRDEAHTCPSHYAPDFMVAYCVYRVHNMLLQGSMLCNEHFVVLYGLFIFKA